MDKLKFKGTPGPWRFIKINDEDCVPPTFYEVRGANDKDSDFPRATLWGDTETEESDARLIAAAPEMLEALLLFVEINNKDYSNRSLGLERDFIELETKVNKAIKKALEE